MSWLTRSTDLCRLERCEWVLWWSDSLPEESRDRCRRRRRLPRDDSDTRDTSLSLSELCRLLWRCLVQTFNEILFFEIWKWMKCAPSVRSWVAGCATFDAARTSLLAAPAVTAAAAAAVRPGRLRHHRRRFRTVHTHRRPVEFNQKFCKHFNVRGSQ